MTAAGQRALLVALADSGARFVVIGGHAVAAHGYERATRDVDIVYSTDLEDCSRFASSLLDLGATVAMADTSPPGGAITAEWLADGGHFVFSTPHGQLDALSWTSGFDFAALDATAEPIELRGGAHLKVCGYEDLISMKRSAGRPRDQQDIAELEAVKKSAGD